MMSYPNKAAKPRNYRYFFIFTLVLILPILNILYARFSAVQGKNVEPANEVENISPGLQIKSIDTQIISKHWGDIGRDDIDEQVGLIKSLNANYIAISTPYDDPKLLREWADSIHNAGLSVWFRSHWLNWEGDNRHPSNMTIQQYLEKTSEFIKENPALFKAGDAFTVCVEPEQVFTARGTDVYDWYSYNKFIIDQIDVADSAFASIGLAGDIHTNWISMNGWVVDNALEKSTVEKMGLITADHYPNQKTAVSPQVASERLASDLDKMYEKWHKPIILGEWGYNIEYEVDDLAQREVVDQTLKALRDKKYLYGFNYWAHMGNSSRLIDDVKGHELKLRPSAYILRQYFAN